MIGGESESAPDDNDFIDESQLRIIEQEMLEHGHSRPEIRQLLESANIQRDGDHIYIDQEESSSHSSQVSNSEEFAKSSQLGNIDFEMSEPSLPDDKWELSDAGSVSSRQFMFSVSSLDEQRQRFSDLQIVLSDQQDLVEGILAQVYQELDAYAQATSQKIIGDEQMMDSSLVLPLMKKQSSTSPVSAILTNVKKDIKFTTEIVSNKHSHKEGTFKVSNANDRQTKGFIAGNMGDRQCITANDQGLVCVLEEDSVNFIASNNLLD